MLMSRRLTLGAVLFAVAGPAACSDRAGSITASGLPTSTALPDTDDVNNGHRHANVRAGDTPIVRSASRLRGDGASY